MLVDSMTRPSHPDILTPREGEVLALLREGLTNPQIAERLSITLDGAKYHVSEILSKLGVSSREEAARWEPSERPWWAAAAVPLAWSWRRANVSWLATGVAGITAVLLVVGAGLLVWGLVRTDASDATSVPAGATEAASATAPQETLTPTAEPAVPSPTGTSVPTLPPTPMEPAVDTSAWETFASPLGFDIRYPPGWTIVESPLNSVLGSSPFERVKIYNPIAERENRRLRDGPAVGSLPTPGAAWLEIHANPLPSFDEGALMGICGTDSQRQSGSASASLTTVAGRPAILCVQRGLALGGELSFESRALWINVQGDKVISISSYMVEGGEQDVPLLEAALSSTAFR